MFACDFNDSFVIYCRDIDLFLLFSVSRLKKFSKYTLEQRIYFPVLELIYDFRIYEDVGLGTFKLNYYKDLYKVILQITGWVSVRKYDFLVLNYY